MCVVCQQHQLLRTLQETRTRPTERPALRRIDARLALTRYPSARSSLVPSTPQIGRALAAP